MSSAGYLVEDQKLRYHVFTETHCNSNSDSKFVGKRVGRKLLLEFWREQIMQNVHNVL